MTCREVLTCFWQNSFNIRYHREMLTRYLEIPGGFSGIHLLLKNVFIGYCFLFFVTLLSFACAKERSKEKHSRIERMILHVVDPNCDSAFGTP